MVPIEWVHSRGSIGIFTGYLRRHSQLDIGPRHACTEVICLVHNQGATVITHTGEVLADFTIDRKKDYQTKNS